MFCITLLDGVSREQWDQDRLRRDAVLYRLLLLGEIVSALPEAFRKRYPDVAWRQIRAFRNLAVHRYFGVDWASLALASTRWRVQISHFGAVQVRPGVSAFWWRSCLAVPGTRLAAGLGA